MPVWLIETRGQHAGTMHPLEPGARLTIGRSSDNVIVVANAQVSRNHVTIAEEDGR